MAAIEKNLYKLFALATAIWIPVMVLVSPPMNPAVFIMVCLSGIWFGIGTIKVGAYYKQNFENSRSSWRQMMIAALLVPFWIWCVDYKKP